MKERTPFKNKRLLRSLERRLMFDAAAVATITSPVFHFDAQDIDGDGDTGNQPADGAAIGTWTDPLGNDDEGTAGGMTQPVYDEDAFGTDRGGIVFDGIDDVFGMATTTELNNQTFYEKSFAVVFKTGDDVSGHQVIYEQGGGTKGYSISIADGHLYAYVWNKTNWSGADQYRSIDLGAVTTDTSYRVIAVHDANTTNTWSANVNGGAFSQLTGVDFQGAHSGQPAIGGVVNASLHPVTNGNAGNANFNGAIGELWSWNHALTTQEVADVDSYFASKWFNNAPTLDSNSGMTLVEGSTLTIGRDDLEASDVEQDVSEIIYEITSVAAHGDLKLNGVVLGVNDTFTQLDIDEGRISYANDGTSNPADSFSFTLYDGQDITGIQTFNFTIDPLPPSDPVITTLSLLNATEAGSTLLTTTILEATDLNTADSNIIYEIASVTTHGDITNNGAILGVGDTFTQQDLIGGLVSYVNSGAGEVTTDSFSFTVTDGSVTTAAEIMPIQITLVEDEVPIINTNNPLSLSKGASVAITMSELQSSDIDTADAALVYEITENSVHGTIRLNGAALGLGDTFTQGDIDGGLVTYVHSGNMSVADSFAFTVSDGATTPVTAVFDILIGPGAALSGDTDVPNIVFHYDAQDINDDGGVSQPSDGTAIDTWSDTSSNGFDATKSGGQRPVLDSSAFGGRGGIVFDGVDDTFDIANDGQINIGTYTEKSFAVVFETGSDVNGVQVIYEQGGGGNGYNIIIIDGTLYAYKWTGTESSEINLGTIEANTTYYVTAVHDATGATLADRTFSASLNGGPLQTINNVDVQAAHSGNIAIGGVMNDSQDPRDESTISGSDTALFKGAVGELLSWNQALTVQEVSDIGDYFFERWVNDPPTLETNDGLSVYEGVTTVIDNGMLEAGDTDQAAAEIGYEIIALPEHGDLILNGVILNVGDSFTQQDINDGKLGYAHDGSGDPADSFKFTLTDGLSITALKTFDIEIDPVPPGEPVFSTLVALSATENATTVLSAANIETTDSDTVDSNIIYEITSVVVHGDITKSGAILSIGDTFTQQDIMDGLIAYQNNGTGEFTTDSFSFTVSDGTITTGASTLPIIVTLANDEGPIVTANNGITLSTGVTMVIGSGELSSTDLDTADNTLVYEITDISEHGVLMNNGVVLNQGDIFTQSDINQSLITYTHDAGFSIFDGFSFIVSDGDNVTGPHTFDITIDTTYFAGDTDISNIVFHFDAKDVDADEMTANPADETTLSIWADTSSNAFDGSASAGTRPVYDADAFGGQGGVRFDGVDDAFLLPDDALVNTGSYTEKSFAVVFETGADTSGTQVIYEQGGSGTGYNVLISDGNLYAYMWSGSSYYALDLGTVDTGKGYKVIVVHDATSAVASERTFSASVNGGPVQSINNVSAQGSHSGDPAIGGVMQDTQFPVGDVDITGSNIYGFKGSIGEIISWNYALNSDDVLALDTHLSVKWLQPYVNINTGTSVDEGGTVAITQAVLDISDLDDADSAISITITGETSNGSLYKDGVTMGLGDAFLMQDIMDGKITYSHDGSETVNDSFGFSISDGRGKVVGNTYAITVNPVNDNPHDVSLSNNSIDENTAAGTVIGSLSSADADSSSFSYSIIGDAGLFAVVGDDLVLAGSPDHETHASYDITIRSDDGAGGHLDRVMTISITDINEAATNITVNMIEGQVAENLAAGTVIGHIVTDDPDAIAPDFSFAGDPGIFGISGSDIILAEQADFETVQSYDLTIHSDDGMFTLDHSFTIEIADIDETVKVDNFIAPDTSSYTPSLPQATSNALPNNGQDDFSGLLRSALTDLRIDLDNIFGNLDDQLIRKAVIENAGFQDISFYGNDAPGEYVRFGGTMEAADAIDILSSLLMGDDTEDEAELRAQLYDYFEEALGDTGLEGLTIEFQKLMDVIQEINKTLNGLDMQAPDLSDEMQKIRSGFDDKVSDFIGQL